ncbi:MAG: hypothetical protein U0N15_03795 [Bifidobacterium choerinum]
MRRFLYCTIMAETVVNRGSSTHDADTTDHRLWTSLRRARASAPRAGGVRGGRTVCLEVGSAADGGGRMKERSAGSKGTHNDGITGTIIGITGIGGEGDAGTA